MTLHVKAQMFQSQDDPSRRDECCSTVCKRFVMLLPRCVRKPPVCDEVPSRNLLLSWKPRLQMASSAISSPKGACGAEGQRTENCITQADGGGAWMLDESVQTASLNCVIVDCGGFCQDDPLSIHRVCMHDASLSKKYNS